MRGSKGSTGVMLGSSTGRGAARRTAVEAKRTWERRASIWETERVGPLRAGRDELLLAYN